MDDPLRLLAIAIGWADCLAIIGAFLLRELAAEWPVRTGFRATTANALAILLLSILMVGRVDASALLLIRGLVSALVVTIGFSGQHCEWTPRWLIFGFAVLFASNIGWTWGRPTWQTLDAQLIAIVAVQAIRVLWVPGRRITRPMLIYAFAILLAVGHFISSAYILNTNVVELDELLSAPDGSE